ncbi:hypothetical protein [Mesorhizobium japonicum]|uniref:hypothetical protein n=1 Tax=Mesorhizobium japonicum TaxID=2066070 RepID=UPI003B5ACEA2
MSDPWPIVISAVATATSIVALSVTTWNTIRIARADRPVEWIMTPVKRSPSRNAKTGWDVWDVTLECAGADAIGFMIEVHQHPMTFTRESRPTLRVGEQIDFTVTGPTAGEAWVKLAWSHPSDTRHPIVAWFPVIQGGTAHYEAIREDTGSPVVRWVRERILRSPVRPGSIRGRRAGWRDRREARLLLRHEKFKGWVAPLPYQQQPKKKAQK